MQVTQELISFIENSNASSQAWMAAGPGRWAGMLDVTPEYWAEQSIFTVEDFRRDELKTNIWETYKEVNGIRPRWMDMDSMSTQELQDTMDRLDVEAEEEYKRDQEDKRLAIVEFEALVEKSIEMGARDRDQAIEWLRQAEGEDDYPLNESMEYAYNIPYGYISGNY